METLPEPTQPLPANATLEQVEAMMTASMLRFGDLLGLIRDRRLYKPGHRNFEAYCMERWGFSRDAADREIGRVRAMAELPPGEPELSQRGAKQKRQNAEGRFNARADHKDPPTSDDGDEARVKTDPAIDAESDDITDQKRDAEASLESAADEVAGSRDDATGADPDHALDGGDTSVGDQTWPPQDPPPAPRMSATEQGVADLAAALREAKRRNVSPEAVADVFEGVEKVGMADWVRRFGQDFCHRAGGYDRTAPVAQVEEIAAAAVKKGLPVSAGMPAKAKPTKVTTSGACDHPRPATNSRRKGFAWCGLCKTEIPVDKIGA